MDLIIAILIYIGAVSSGTEVTENVIQENENAIEYFQHNAEFMDYYENDYKHGKIVVMDISDMDGYW